MTKLDLSQYSMSLKKAKTDLQNAILEQERLDERADQVKNEIAQLRRIIAGLSDLLGVEYENWAGLTECVTAIMEDTPRPLETKDVVQELIDGGFSFATQKNAPASVASVLNRLADRGKIQKDATGERTIWIGPKTLGKAGKE